MARGIVAYDADLGRRVLELQGCSLLEDLSPEQIYFVAKHSRSLDISSDDTNKVIQEVNGRFVFIVKGRFDYLYFPSDKSKTDLTSAVVLRTIAKNEYWGEHFLLNGDSKKNLQTGLRSVADGRLISLHPKRIKMLLQQWPVVQNKLLYSILKRGFAHDLELGTVQREIEDRDFVLDRVDKVGQTLAEMLEKMSGQSEELVDAPEQIQTKYLLSARPGNLKGMQSTFIEQAYLPHRHEDRIRTVNHTNYTRTKKFGEGTIRTKQDYPITSREYQNLLEKKIHGSKLIIKRRYEKTENEIVITVDDFIGEGELKNLFLAEINYPNKELIESFQIPDWLASIIVKEVTEDKSYGNRSLAVHGRPANSKNI
jgi:adenylate cyclase